jgi:hypothetical protein
MRRFADVVYGSDYVQVGVPQQTQPTTGAAAGNLVGAVLDIFGRVVVPRQTIGAAPVATSGTPLWVWILIPVAGVVAIGVISRKLRRKKK